MLPNQPCAPRALPRGQGPGGPSLLSSRHVLSAWSQDRAQKGRPWPENLPPGKTAPWGLPRGSPEVPKAPRRGWGSSSGGLPLDQGSPLQPMCPRCPPSPTPGRPHVSRAQTGHRGENTHRPLASGDKQSREEMGWAADFRAKPTRALAAVAPSTQLHPPSPTGDSRRKTHPVPPRCRTLLCCNKHGARGGQGEPGKP